MEPLSLTAADVAASAGGDVVHGDRTAVIGRIVIDSRTLEAGDCFVALAGERFDGHDFVADVLARGAGAVVVSRDLPEGPLPAGAVVIRVDDTTEALQDLAHEVRLRSGVVAPSRLQEQGESQQPYRTAALVT